MARRFTAIPQDTFEALQVEAGILLYNFDLDNETYKPEDMICATTGGITATCAATYSDLGADVDNCPVNMKELKQLDSWDCRLAFTSLGTDAKGIRLALGAADIDSNDPTKIIPRRSLSQDDFTGVWWVGDRADGGMVAIHLLNALSSSGFSLQTTKAGKGQTSVELTGHVSINAQDVVPMQFYSRPPLASSASVPEQTVTLLGKSVSEMISEDTVIREGGAVMGTLRYVENFLEFSDNPEEQSGHYFPVVLSVTGNNMTLKKNGVVIPNRENVPFDRELLLRVPNQSDEFTVEVDGVEVLTLSFHQAIFEEEEITV